MRRFLVLDAGVLLFLIIGIVLLGCGGAAVGPSVNINLSPATVSLSRGATAQITAQALDANNNVVAAPALAYDCVTIPAETACSSANSPITVSSNGLICAGQWDVDFIRCQTTGNANNLLPLGTASITAASTTASNTSFKSSAVVVTDHEPVDTLQIVPNASNPTPGPGNPTGCFSQNGTPNTTPNAGMFTAQAFSNDPAACQRITGSASVPCQVPSSTIGNINWAVSPAPVGIVNATTTSATDPVGVTVTAATPGQATVVASIGALGSLVSGSATFTTCAVASIQVQTSSGNNSFTAPISSTVTLAAQVTDSQNISLNSSTSGLSLIWLSSQPALAEVNLGTVNTAAPGTAEITAACLPPSCNVNFVPPQPVYSDNAVTATITGTVDSTVLVTTATAPPCSATTACTNSNLIVPIDSTTNVPGSAFTLPAGVQVNSMVMTPAGDPAFLGTICANGTTGPSGVACSGLLRFDPTVTTVIAPNPTITGTALVTDGNHVVVSDPATNQIFIATAVPGIEAIPDISIASFIAAAPAGATESVNTVTITTNTPHGLSSGQSVLVAGVGVAGYNGSFTVLAVPSPTSFTYTDPNPNSGLAASGGGYVTSGAAAAISPDGSKIYIVTGGKLYIYDPSLPLQARTLSGTISATSSQAVSFFATGPMAYVADSGGDDVVASCSDTLFATGPVLAPGFPTHIAAVPNASAMVDANGNSSSIDEVDVTPNSPTAYGVCPPNITNSRTSASFGTSFTAKQLLVTPDSKLALILSDKGVLAYNLGTKQTSVVPLTGGAQALSGGVTPDGASLYVGASDGNVHRIDLTKTPPTDAQSIAVNLCPTVATGCAPDFVVVRPVATVATLSALVVTPTNPTIGTGASATQQFTATGTFSDNTKRDMTNFVTWSSSNPIVAVIGPITTVNPPITTPGLAQGLATGTTTITASSAGVSGSTTLTVN
ncbi:MAG: Ig-like domain-containing protein [Terriglobales bacterium]